MDRRRCTTWRCTKSRTRWDSVSSGATSSSTPSLGGGDPVTPPPDTHFDGANAIAAFDDAGGTDYQGQKVPVENERGGSGARDAHWRKSVMGSELMTFALSGDGEFSAITIQSMADLGYVVDDSVADDYTVADITGQARTLGAPGERQHRHCIVHPPTDIRFVPETRPVMLPPSAIQLRAIDGSLEQIVRPSRARTESDSDE